jgi:hypothetical protein
MPDRDHDRFSLIGHAEMAFMNPLREGELHALLLSVKLDDASHVLDVCGGRADLSRAIATRTGCEATSVDLSAQACREATLRAQGRRVNVVCSDVRAFLARDAKRYDLALCVGGTHAFGSGLDAWNEALSALHLCADAVLVGDLVATSDVAAKVFDIPRLHDLEALPALASTRAKLILDAARVDAYERAWCASVQRYIDAHPSDPRAAWARQRIAWTDAPEFREARAHLRFALWLLDAKKANPLS